jgi:photosystem II stability/assembly factor-like uncharacterized protein
MTDRAWIATRKGLFELRHRGGGWRVERHHFLGEPVSAVLPPDGQGRMLAALNLGHFGVKLHRSDDAGDRWTEVATPTYPEQPADATGPAWTLVQVWTLARGHGGTVWAGTLPGGLFRSDDLGASWQLVRSLWDRPERLEWMGGGYDVPGIHSICPHPTAPAEMLVGVSCGGAWRSTDGGDSWASRAQGMRADFMPPERAEDPNIQDPHCIVRCAAAPEVLWCQHHGGIWRSTDNGASWQALKAPVSSFGFTVAVHPQDPDTAWFVPAIADQTRVPVDGALVVNRTRDGGRSWQTLRAGLPQQHAYDLMYRHALDVSADGQRLLMGSTTGGVWASEDGGDHWQTVSLNLPMVHAVRLG